MGRRIDMEGLRQGKLTVMEEHGRKRRQIVWRCVCDCGNTTYVATAQLRHGHTSSCGCLQREAAARSCISRSVTHGRTNTRLYNIWHSMKQRCEYPPHIVYENYGGRGISVCREWSEAFEPFMEWAESNGYARNLSIDRVESNAN